VPIYTRAQLGTKDESVFGTEVVVDGFDEYLPGTTINPHYGFVESKGMRAGNLAARKDRRIRYKSHADGKLVIPVMSKGFGRWPKRMLGTVGTAGPTDSAYTHTGTMGSLLGDGFTGQINKPFHPGDTDHVVTCFGTKVPKWKMSDSAANDDPLKVEMDIDAVSFDVDTALAAASYPSGTVEPLAFVGGAVTIGGDAVIVTDWSLECDQKLMTNRRGIRSSALRREQAQEAVPEIKWEVGMDWEDAAQYNRFAAALASGATAQIVLTYTAFVLIGATTYPSLTITIDEASFDMHETSDPSAPLTQKFGGSGLYDGSASPITLAYVTADATTA
jgi:hypothetical protein